MEHSSAQFVTMVMDRLQAVEEQNIRLQDENKELISTVSALTQGLYLQKDLTTFTDGAILCPAFGEGVATLWPQEHMSYFMDFRSTPLDPLHANATAFYGRIGFDFGFKEWPKLLVIGKDDERTTVYQYSEIHAWCNQWKAVQPDTHVTGSIHEHFDGWKFGYQDYESNLTVYILK